MILPKIVLPEIVLSLYKQYKYKIYSNPKQLNIFGLRKTANNNFNLFNDFIGYFYTNPVDNSLAFNAMQATTTPGYFWLQNLMNPKGTAILVPGQYIDTWSIALHQGKYEALCQRKPVRVYRDKNKDTILDKNPETIENGIFGINIHRANKMGLTKYIEKHSAGCQVIADIAEFNKLMDLAKIHKEKYGNLFTYTLFEV